MSFFLLLKYATFKYATLKIVFQGAEDPPPPPPPPPRPPLPYRGWNIGGKHLSQVGNKQLGAICPLYLLLKYATLKYVTFK